MIALWEQYSIDNGVVDVGVSLPEGL
jgi:hypothetical protein